jgi:hypothetical protein
MIHLSLSLGLIIFLVIHTNFIIEYYNLFDLKFSRTINEYNDRNKDGYIESFNEFLIKRGTFLGKLFSCPICLSIWGGAVFIPFIGFYFLAVSYISLFSYYLLVLLKKLCS